MESLFLSVPLWCDMSIVGGDVSVGGQEVYGKLCTFCSVLL